MPVVREQPVDVALDGDAVQANGRDYSLALERLSELLADIPAIIWETALNREQRTSHFTFLSESAERLLGYPREELLRPESWQAMVYPDDRESFAAQIQRLYSGAERAIVQHRVVTGDGRILPIEATLTLVRDEKGEPSRLRGITLDISERYRSAERLRLLVEASKLFAESADFRRALNEALRLLVPHIADVAQVFFTKENDQTDRIAIVAATPELESLTREGSERFIPREDTRLMVFRVLQAKESMLLPEITEAFRREHAVSEDHFEYMQRAAVRSAILTPLFVGDEMFGVITLSRRATAALYTDDDRLFLEEFSRAASYAYHKAHLSAEVQSELTRRRTAEERLRILTEASSLLSSENDPAQIFSELPAMLVSRIADLCLVLLPAADGSVSLAGAASAVPETIAIMREINERFPVRAEDPFGTQHVFRTGKPEVHLHFDDELVRSFTRSEEHFALFKQLGLRSSIFVPLISHGEILGAVLFAMTDASGRLFENEDIVLAEEISLRAATAIYKARLYTNAQQEIQRRSELQSRLELIERVSERVASSLNLQDLLRDVAHIIVPQFADWMTIDLTNSVGDLNRIFIYHGDPKLQEKAETYRLRFGMEATEPLIEIMRNGQIVHIPDVRVADKLNKGFSSERMEAVRELGVSSLLMVPLNSRRRTLGVLGFDYGHSGRKYSAHDVELARDLGSRIAAGIDNALLFAEAHAEIERRIVLQKRLEAAKEDAEIASRAKDQFIATLSHELRTPLTPVLATVDLLEGDSSLPEHLRPFLSLVRRNIEIEARLIDDLLDMTRITKGKLRMNAADIDLHALLPEVIEICRRDIEQAHVILHNKFDLLNSFVRGDKDRLSQVFWNVIHNATKFTPEGGVITIETRSEGDYAIIEIRDTGYGIERGQLIRIFDPFEQERSEKQREQQRPEARSGLGLGLAITKSIVEMHGGTIEARSDGHGKGSTFIIRLKVLEVKQPVTEQPEQTIIHRNGGHILFVDDHADTNAALKVLLERRGYRVTTASTVSGGFDLARKHEFDLLVSDIGLPDGNGTDLLRLIRAEEEALCKPQLKAIAVSGYGTDADIARSHEAGFVFHLKKPIAFPDLERAISEALAN